MDPILPCNAAFLLLQCRHPYVTRCMAAHGQAVDSSSVKQVDESDEITRRPVEDLEAWTNAWQERQRPESRVRHIAREDL